ncbi:hypothetical protein V8G54_007994, partial [Vigna mungo]
MGFNGMDYYPSKKAKRLPSNIDDLADDCLASVFRLLGTVDRNSCSLVCRRWLKVDGDNRHSLSLTAESHLSDFIPSLFLRFNTVTEVSLRHVGYQDETISAITLIRISQLCRNLTRLQVQAPCFLTDKDLEHLAMNCKALKKFQLRFNFLGGGGMHAFMDHWKDLEDLSLDGFHGTENAWSVAPPKPKLKAISLKDTVLFYPFLGAKNLRVLKLVRCNGDLDTIFHVLTNEVTGIVELHLVMLEISDIGLEAFAKCSNLEVLHLIRTPKCSDKGLVAVAKGCNRSLRKLRVGWDMEEIGSRGLMGVAEYCVNVEQLVLIGVNPSKECFEMLVSNCKGLEQLAVCGSETVGDSEMNCMAAKCRALREVYMEGCPISDEGVSALVLGGGCPKLEIVKVWKCERVRDRDEQHVQCGHRTVR